MVPLTVSQGRSKNHTDCPVVWWMTLSRLRCYKSWCHRAQGWAKIATTDLSAASKPRVAIRVQWWHWIMWCDFKKHGTKSNLCKKKKTNWGIYSCWVRDTQCCKHLILFDNLRWSQWQMQCKGQPSTPGARLQTMYFTTIMLCSDQINFTLDVHLFHHFDHRRCTNPSKPTLCQRDISTTPWHRQRHKTWHLATIRCVCPWTLLPLEHWTSRGREGRILEEKEETNTLPLILIFQFNDASIESIGILIVFWKVLECFGLFLVAVGEGSCFNELDGCGSWQANVVTSLLLQKIKWIKSSKTSSTSQQ